MQKELNFTAMRYVWHLICSLLHHAKGDPMIMCKHSLSLAFFKLMKPSNPCAPAFIHLS